ncbi:MAG: hypothetical protein SCARUB_04087 [Candidatus Scalindua rubra]|uniref:Uncharacterized protein n=1 Tax=Candidatus Scalindua rubra TaxID=1872076 RepID=A0A1E3X566_9BACT|nr:MAG: hypothetical protein SCARUB_04087 [Candidatus Scalindua rubra]
MKPKKITKKQIPKIWARTKEIGLEEENLRKLVKKVSGDPSISKLTKDQAIAVIDRLEGKKVRKRIKGKKRFALSVVCIDGKKVATPKQLEYIETLGDIAGWKRKHIKSFILKKFGKDDMNSLTRQEAGVMMKVLKHERKRRLCDVLN